MHSGKAGFWEVDDSLVQVFHIREFSYFAKSTQIREQRSGKSSWTIPGRRKRAEQEASSLTFRPLSVVPANRTAAASRLQLALQRWQEKHPIDSVLMLTFWTDAAQLNEEFQFESFFDRQIC